MQDFSCDARPQFISGCLFVGIYVGQLFTRALFIWALLLGVPSMGGGVFLSVLNRPNPMCAKKSVVFKKPPKTPNG